MQTKKKTAPYNTTIQVDNVTRKDIRSLAQIEARKKGVVRLYDKDYITILIAREKAAAIASGDLKT